MKKNPKPSSPAPLAVGSLVAIVDRFCSDKVQAEISRGSVLRIEKIGHTKSGATRLFCTEHEATAKGSPRRVTINADRFRWEPITEHEVIQARNKANEAYMRILNKRMLEKQRNTMEKVFQKECENSVRTMVETMEFPDHVRVSILPLISIEMVWLQAERCCRYCAEHKVSAVLKVTRAIRALHEEYDSFLARDLRPAVRANLRRIAEKLLEDSEMRRNLQLMHLTLRNEYFTQFPLTDIPYLDLRIEATLGFIFIDAYKRRVETANRILREKAGGRINQSVSIPLITNRLHAQFDALLGNFVLQKGNYSDVFLGIVDRSFAELRITSAENLEQTA